jgi:hypothetical protein
MLKTNWTLSAMLLAASCIAIAPQARAQEPFLASFKLPMAAHFGNTVLQPGDYKIYRIAGMSAIRVTGEGSIATIMASSVDSHVDLEKSRLTLINVDGTFSLKRFDSGSAGSRFDFVPTKDHSRNSERASVTPSKTVDIALHQEAGTQSRQRGQ